MSGRGDPEPNLAAATRSRRLFLQLQHLIHQRAARARKNGIADISTESIRTVTDFHRTRLRVFRDGEVVLELVYRCDGGARGWPDPARPHLQDRTSDRNFYALSFEEGGSAHWSHSADGRAPHHTNRELCNGWFASLLAGCTTDRES